MGVTADQEEEEENDVNCQTEDTGEGSQTSATMALEIDLEVWILKSEVWLYNRPHDEQSKRAKCFLMLLFLCSLL